ncbi:MAG: mechanosensitive ion channel family protein [Ardenticatenaceae bacterium]
MADQWFSEILTYLPTLLRALGLFVVGWLIAAFIRWFVRRLGSRLGLDGLVERSGLMDNLRQAKIERSPSDMIAQIFFWLIFLSFTLLAFDALEFTKGVNLIENAISYVPSLLAAILVLIVGSQLAQLLGKFVQVTTASMGIDFHSQLGQVVRSLFMIMVGIIAVEQLGLNVSLLNDLFQTMLTLVMASLALAFGLGARDVSRNALAGYYARDLLSPGDQIVINGVAGTLEGIGPLNSEIETEGGRLVIPNSWLTEKEVLIQSAYDDQS